MWLKPSLQRVTLALPGTGKHTVHLECWFRPAPPTIRDENKHSRHLSTIRVELQNKVLREGQTLSGVVVCNVADNVAVTNVYGLLR
jgi:hypothetical protein